MKERQEGGDRLPQFRIQSGCALTNMNAVFRKNLTAPLAIEESGMDTAPTLAAHSNKNTGQSAVPPDGEDMHLGA